MKKSGVNFPQTFDYFHNEEQKELSKKAPAHEVLLDMAVHKLLSPIVAQQYRIPNIWQGDLESETGMAMLSCDSKGPLSLMITKIWMDPHAGEVAVGRIYSGPINHGETVWAIGGAKSERVQQVSMMVGGDRIPVPTVVAGNIAAITGTRPAAAGVTVTSDKVMRQYESICNYS